MLDMDDEIYLQNKATKPTLGYDKKSNGQQVSRVSASKIVFLSKKQNVLCMVPVRLL